MRAPLTAVLLLAAAPAAAQTGASLSLSSQSVSRGQSVSHGYPVAELAVSHDDASGAYLGGSITGMISDGGSPDLLGWRVYLGYARRVGGGVSIDAGIADTRYTRASGYARGAGYTEVYAGLSTRFLSARLSVSPGYLGRKRTTLYGEVDGVLPVASRWQLSAHAGMLGDLSGPYAHPGYHPQFDWRIGIANRRGPFRLELALAGAGHGSYGYRATVRPRLIAGASYDF